MTIDGKSISIPNLRVLDAVVHEPISGEEARAAIDVPYRHISCRHDSGGVQTELTEGRDEHESEVRRLDGADHHQSYHWPNTHREGKIHLHACG